MDMQGQQGLEDPCCVSDLLWADLSVLCPQVCRWELQVCNLSLILQGLTQLRIGPESQKRLGLLNTSGTVKDHECL